MSDRMLGNIGTASESKRVTAHEIINRNRISTEKIEGMEFLATCVSIMATCV